MGTSFATTDTLNLISSIANFKVIANTDYTVSAPEAGELVNKDNDAILGFKIEVSKEK